MIPFIIGALAVLALAGESKDKVVTPCEADTVSCTITVRSGWNGWLFVERADTTCYRNGVEVK